MKKRILAALLALIMVFGLVACGNDTNTDPSASDNGQAAVQEEEDGIIKLTLWSSYTAISNNKLQHLVAKFNAQSDKYEVTMEVGQSGSETRAKLAASTPEYYPDLFMGTNNCIAEYAGSRYTAPIQPFLDADEDKWTSDILGTVKKFMSDADGNLIGLPVGTSVKGYMVNTTVLDKMGYTLEDLTSFEAVAKIAQEAKAQGLIKYGYIPSGANNISNMLLLQGVDLVDAGNGYEGKVTNCLYDEGETYDALYKYCEILAGMYATGAAMKNNSGADGGTSTFINGQALFWATTSSFVYEFQDVDMSIEWGFVPFRGIDDNAVYSEHVLAEGTSIYLGNTGNEKKMQGAYEFIKFLGQEENQIFWCTFRGYTPYLKSVLESDEWISWRDANHPTEKWLEGPLMSESMDLRYPNLTVMSRIQSADSELQSYLAADPNPENIDGYIQKVTKSIQDAIDMENARNG